MASIQLEHVGVHFMLPRRKALGLLGSVKSIATGGVMREEHGRLGVAALSDVSLDLRDGDRVGLIGHNGAGKTTLLRVLSGILPPTSGRTRIEGRVSALLSIQLGLNNQASGYENIRIRARYMGCSEEEIEANFEDIARFSELGEYLDLPLKTYSSGMRLRLAFAIATAFRPDILILDE
ncbi:MAG: ATP-binding cassette domain-containing protein, partial [Pseudomonadota bacterium]